MPCFSMELHAFIKKKKKVLVLIKSFVFIYRFMPSFLRLGSWNVVMFVTYEQLKRAMMVARHNWSIPH